MNLVSVSAKGLLFDMDGVLVSSIGAVNRCWRVWCKQHNIPNADTFEIPHGTRALDIIRTLKPEWDETRVAQGLRAIEDLEIDDTAGLKVLPGVKALLSALPPDRWAIVTSATGRLLVSRLEAAGLPVPKRLISADVVERGKPDPEPYRRGAELLGLSPADCIVVEDAPSGVDAGIAAGARVLGVLGTHTREELSQATWVVPSLTDLSVEITAASLELRFPVVD
jgi:sugar-phosphatase